MRNRDLKSKPRLTISFSERQMLIIEGDAKSFGIAESELVRRAMDDWIDIIRANRMNLRRLPA